MKEYIIRIYVEKIEDNFVTLWVKVAGNRVNHYQKQIMGVDGIMDIYHYPPGTEPDANEKSFVKIPKRLTE